MLIINNLFSLILDVIFHYFSMTLKKEKKNLLNLWMNHIKKEMLYLLVLFYYLFFETHISPWNIIFDYLQNCIFFKTFYYNWTIKRMFFSIMKNFIINFAIFFREKFTVALYLICKILFIFIKENVIQNRWIKLFFRKKVLFVNWLVLTSCAFFS